MEISSEESNDTSEESNDKSEEFPNASLGNEKYPAKKSQILRWILGIVAWRVAFSRQTPTDATKLEK